MLNERLQLWSGLMFDRTALLLAVLLVGVTIGSVALVPYFQAPAETGGEPKVSQADELQGKSTAEKAAAGGGWAIAEAVFAGAVLVLALLWRRLPEWVQELVKDTIAYSAFMLIGGIWAIQGHFNLGAALAIGGFVGYSIIDEIGLWWVINNVLALGIAVLAGATAGIKLGIPFVLLGLVGLSLYDHYFANKQTWMFTLGGVMLTLRLPVLIVWPRDWTFDWDTLAEEMGEVDGEADDMLAGGIGMADLLLPAMFAAAIAAYPGEAATVAGWPVGLVGVIGGLTVAAFRLRWEMEHHGSGAGLPAITAGAVGGWVVMLPVALVL